MKNCGEFGIDRELVLLESWYETDKRSRVTTTNGVYYSTEPPLALIDKARLTVACPHNLRLKATRHNLKRFEKHIVLYSKDGISAYPTQSPSKLTCVWIFNHQYTMEFVSPTKTRIIYKQFGISKEIDASIHHLSRQRKRQHELFF
ncbi:competence protein ComK [Planococcus maritimus]|uniref:competence protein ComK n=1 Tax=Planococcus maritimus TaxID=192421 RepID=UPI00232C4EC4|nr:competence protein ComK [Planococcus maritimus]